MAMIELFQAARRTSVPILVIRTADQQATTEAIRVAVGDHPVITWDAVRGLQPVVAPDGTVNKKAQNALGQAKIKSGDQSETQQFVDAMVAIARLPRGTVVLAHNAHRQLVSSEPYTVAQSVQCIANLRDVLKQDFRMLILLAPIFVAPSELEHDIVVIDHDLPTSEELERVVNELHASASLKAPSKDTLTKAVDAISGLSAFAAEQVTAMSLREDGLDLDALWERKRVTIEQTRGLRVWRGEEKFADLVGLDNVKACLKQQLKSKTPVGIVVFIDEIDKVLANVEQDTSGVRMDQLRTLLTEMENNEWLGSVMLGVAGGGKSAIAKAFGNEAGVPTIALDLGDMEGPHVGESEAMLRHAISVVKAIGHGHAFFIATSNNASVMRPELQRRFTEGMFFFDVMTAEEREAAWQFYLKKYGLDPKQPRPQDEGWTGAEVRNCCRRAWNTSVPLAEAAKFIVPMALSRADEIEKLRQYAHNRLLSATQPGMYQYEAAPMQRFARAIELPKPVIEAIKEMKES